MVQKSISEYKIDFLKGISDYFWDQTEANGQLICPKHRIEHTGKNCYSIFIDTKLFEIANDEKYFKRAKSRALRTVEKLCRDPEFGRFIFYPGRLHDKNMSDNIIDGGACVDSLVHFLKVFDDKVKDREREEILDAIFKHCDTYLKTFAVEKPVTNRRLWGATGLASGYTIFKEETWKEALIASIERSFGEQKEDGSFFYQPNYKDYDIYEGVYDVTTYYHSRHIAFAVHVLEQLNLVKKYLENLKKGLDFLIAMYQPNGLKNLCLETKRWYWESEYEVVSHAFDIYALIKGYEYTNQEIYERYARKSFKRILEHCLSDGGITSHQGRQNNFQCRIFWNGHLAWLTKVIENVQADDPTEDSIFYKIFSDAQVVKFEGANICAILRGGKAPINIDWGCPVGGGSLLYFSSKKEGWENKLKIKRWVPLIDNNFIFLPNFWEEIINFPKLTRLFFKVNRMEIGARIVRANDELMNRGILFYFKYLFKHILIKYLSEIRGTHTTQWATECEIITTGDGVQFVLHPSRRNGDLLDDTSVERFYTFKEDELIVEEKIDCRGSIRLIKYQMNPICNEVSIETNCKFDKNRGVLIFKIVNTTTPSEISIKYSLGKT